MLPLLLTHIILLDINMPNSSRHQYAHNHYGQIVEYLRLNGIISTRVTLIAAPFLPEDTIWGCAKGHSFSLRRAVIQSWLRP